MAKHELKKMLTPTQLKTVDKLLGNTYDSMIAKRFDRSREWVRQRREGKGIPVCRRIFKEKVPVSSVLSPKEARRMERAIKQTGTQDRSKYVRMAIVEKNKEVLDDGPS